MAMRGETLLSAGLVAMVRLFFVSSPAVGDEELYQIWRQALHFRSFAGNRRCFLWSKSQRSKVESRHPNFSTFDIRPSTNKFRSRSRALRVHGDSRLTGADLSSPAAAFFRSSDRGERWPRRPGGSTGRSPATGRPGSTVRPSNRPYPAPWDSPLRTPYT